MMLSSRALLCSSTPGLYGCMAIRAATIMVSAMPSFSVAAATATRSFRSVDDAVFQGVAVLFHAGAVRLYGYPCRYHYGLSHAVVQRRRRHRHALFPICR